MSHENLGIIVDPVIVSASQEDGRAKEYISALISQGFRVFGSIDEACRAGSISLLLANGSIRTLREFGRRANEIPHPCFDMFSPELHHFSNYQHQIPSQLKLNSKGLVLPFSECSEISFDALCQRLGTDPDDGVFMRPDPALKVCEAQALNSLDWDSWLNYTKRYTAVLPSTFLWWFPVVDIQKEYRCFIQDGKCISASTYGFEVEPENVDDDGVLRDFVEFVAKGIELDDPCYVIDVALTQQGLKVIELNCAATSGIYQLDLVRLAKAWKEGALTVYADRYDPEG
jgi:hypothetical protein